MRLDHYNALLVRARLVAATNTLHPIALLHNDMIDICPVTRTQTIIAPNVRALLSGLASGA
jgi:hypothetical protein